MSGWLSCYRPTHSEDLIGSHRRDIDGLYHIWQDLEALRQRQGQGTQGAWRRGGAATKLDLAINRPFQYDLWVAHPSAARRDIARRLLRSRFHPQVVPDAGDCLDPTAAVTCCTTPLPLQLSTLTATSSFVREGLGVA